MLKEWTLCFLGTDERASIFCNWDESKGNIMTEGMGMSVLNLGFLFKP